MARGREERSRIVTLSVKGMIPAQDAREIFDFRRGRCGKSLFGEFMSREPGKLRVKTARAPARGLMRFRQIYSLLGWSNLPEKKGGKPACERREDFTGRRIISDEISKNWKEQILFSVLRGSSLYPSLRYSRGLPRNFFKDTLFWRRTLNPTRAASRNFFSPANLEYRLPERERRGDRERIGSNPRASRKAAVRSWVS